MGSANVLDNVEVILHLQLLLYRDSLGGIAGLISPELCVTIPGDFADCDIRRCQVAQRWAIEDPYLVVAFMSALAPSSLRSTQALPKG